VNVPAPRVPADRIGPPAYPLEHVRDRHGYIWRVVRDGGMATRSDYEGVISEGIDSLADRAGPLLRVDLMGALLREAREQRDRARGLAVALEQENAALADALSRVCCDCCLDDEAAEMLPDIETVAVREGLL
jgi:hypothetical protein